MKSLESRIEQLEADNAMQFEIIKNMLNITNTLKEKMLKLEKRQRPSLLQRHFKKGVMTYKNEYPTMKVKR